ncbi:MULTISPECIES: DUF6634 family protein [Alphaproteobacteria]|uniref:DUF6634 family protein n=2 Tax=Pseudomonadota TaxID=1224 RepID=UPI0032975BDD
MNKMHDDLYYNLLTRSITAFQAAMKGPDPHGKERDAPMVDDYLIVLQGQKMKLHGWGAKHPNLGTTFIQTSLLIHVTENQKWAHTLSRWYRLANPVKLDTSQLSPDIDLAGYCVPVGLGGVSVPLHLARRVMAQQPTRLSRIAEEKGFNALSETLSEIARIWPPKGAFSVSD